MLKRSAAFLFVVAIGCGSSGSNSTSASSGSTPADQLPDLKPGAPPANGFQVILPIVRDLQPGSSNEMCTWTNMVLDHDIDVKSSQGFQTKTGHHIVIFYTTKTQPAGTTRVCADEDMASFRFAIGTGGEGLTAVLPGDLATHIPAGAQIVVNHHYLNAGVTAIDAQSAVNVVYADPGAKITRNGNLAFVDTSLRIPPGNQGMDINCTMQNDMSLWVLTPHMHQWGTHITVDHTKLADTSTSRLIDLQWDPDFAFHPPQITHDESSPYQLSKGDKIKVHCDYTNTTSSDLTFGLEMCVFFAQTVDKVDLGSMACDGGQWGPF